MGWLFYGASITAAGPRVSSSADDRETRPFPAPAAALADAEALLGKACADVFSPQSTVFEGFEPVSGFSPVIGKNSYVLVRSKTGARFAFLLTENDGDLTTCKIADVATLPSARKANIFLQCRLDDQASTGFGMRLRGHRHVIAYWAVDADQHKLERVPLEGAAASSRVRCKDPEAGE